MSLTELKMAPREQIVKEYLYSERKLKGALKDEVKSYLIVTNKRIINRNEGNKILAQKEIPISSADYIYSMYGIAIGNIILPFLLILVGIALLVLNSRFSWGGVLLWPGIIAIVIGVGWFVWMIIRRRDSVFVKISGKAPEYHIISIGATNIENKKTGSKKLNKKDVIRELKIKVNKETAIQMVNEIGALILQLKDQSPVNKSESI